MGRVLRRLASRYGIGRRVDAPSRDPYRVLVDCVLSLRTKDEVSEPAGQRLFARARTPTAMLRLPARTIAGIIYPVGFYRRKAAQIRALSRLLVDDCGGRVPDRIDALLALPGVGRKTANLVVTQGFGRPGICVDTHVHRITNRLGWVRTRHPHETESELRRILPRRWWIPINAILVRHGQSVCKPISPLCSQCVVRADCPRRGVGRWR